MGSLLSYSLLTGATLIPMYLIIRLCLSRCTFFRFNRVMILCSYIVALSMPLWLHLVSTISFNAPEVTLQVSVDGPLAMTVADDYTSQNSPVARVLTFIILLYGAGLLFFIIREIMIWTKMLRFIAKCDKTVLPSGWTLCSHDNDNVAPFSWGRYIVLSQKDYSSSGRNIVLHETMHLQCRHWIDLILAEVVAILLWYNPVGWLMRNELQTIHEYEADEAVLSSGINAREYQILLIKKAVGSRFPSIANSLDHSNLSKRIKMMLRKKTSPGRRWLAAAAVPAVALCAFVALSPSVVNALDRVSSAKVTQFQANGQISEATPKSGTAIKADGTPTADLNPATSESIESIRATKGSANDNLLIAANTADAGNKAAATKPDAGKNFTTSEKMPQYPGGEAAMMKFLSENLKYPEGDKTGGRVVVQFVVQTDGTIGETKVVRSVSPELDAEAVRVVKLLKMTPGEIDGKPVNVWYTLPVAFKPGKQSKENAPVTGEPEPDGKVFTAVEDMPQFPGGMTGLMQNLMENIKYPEAAVKNDIQGTVVVRFVINKDGSIGEADVIRGVDPELDAEAVRVVKNLPDFIPGKMGGKPVAVWYTLPISFKLKGDKPKDTTPSQPAE